MKKITIGKKHYRLFSSYKEMDRKTLLKISAIRSKFLFENSQPEGFYALKIQAFTACCNIPYSKILRISTYEWADLLPHIEYVFTSTPNLDQNLIPKIKMGVFGRKVFHGPKGLLKHATLFEFCEADTAFMNAGNSQKLDDVYLLAAILYRPIRKDLKEFKSSKEWTGDIREPYNQESAVERSKMFRKLPLYQLVAIFLYYWSFRDQELLNAPGLDILFKEKDMKYQPMNLGWYGTMLAASNKEFGNFDQTKEQNWKAVLYSMAKNLTDMENRQKAMEEERLFSKLNKRS